MRCASSKKRRILLCERPENKKSRVLRVAYMYFFSVQSDCPRTRSRGLDWWRICFAVSCRTGGSSDCWAVLRRLEECGRSKILKNIFVIGSNAAFCFNCILDEL